MPKKHDPKKREKRKRGNHVSKKKTGMIRERRAIISRSKPHLSIHPSTHTLAPFDRDCMTCFFMDHLFDFTTYRTQVCMFLSYLELHKGLQQQERSKVDTALVRKYKLSASRELSWELCHVFKNLSKKKVSPDGLRIYEQVSTILCTVLTLNSPRQGDG